MTKLLPAADLVTSGIMQLFNDYGNEDYDGEPVSQSAHMIQCGMLAIEQGADNELVIGAFLHDIGHLIRHNAPTEEMGGFGAVNHEGIGADYLRERGFSERVCAVVDKHVDAKRYLVATDVQYKDKLSPASLETLKWQGGPLDEQAVVAFREHPYFKEIIQVRLWDEEGKRTDLAMLPLQHFADLIYNYLSQSGKSHV
ncbi:MAG: HDIG domain-containing protein [Chitinophagaceae bacterium]